MVHEHEGFFANRWLTAILIDSEADKGITMKILLWAFEKANIDARPLWKPIHLQPIFRDAPFYGNGI